MTLHLIKSNLPKIIVMAFFVSIAVSCVSTNRISQPKMNSYKLNDSLLVDRDGNKYTIKAFSDNNLWMATNLKVNISDSYCYDDSAENCERYGRLYTWQAAQMGCRLLGKGWRLPTKDEWQRLAGFYGRTAKDSVEARKRAYQSLLYTGNSQFNALLGGGRAPDGQYARSEAHGFYWTATENDNSTAWFANYAKGSQSLYHQSDGEKTRAFSVRCIKSIDTLK